MTTRAIDDEPDRDLGKLLGLAAAAVVGGLFWGLIILAIRWVLQLPPPALLRLTAVALLFAGTAVVFVALVRIELSVPPTPDTSRGRRPERGDAPSGAARASSGESALPQAGGRALHVVRPS